MYISATDEQFTKSEQNWIDFNFGHGTADRFLASFPSAEWENVFSRVGNLIGNLSETEKKTFCESIEGFLTQLISVDGVGENETVRLQEYLDFLTELGLPISIATQQSASPEVPEPSLATKLIKFIRINQVQIVDYIVFVIILVAGVLWLKSC